MEIETKNASIDTFSVTINALHVSGKQMTLSVFRQLPESDCFYDDAEEDDNGNYTPYLKIGSRCNLWGRVNYKIGKSNNWVVFSCDGILFRTGIEEYMPMSTDYSRDSEGRDDFRYDHKFYLQRFKFLDKLPQLFIAV